MFSFKANVSNCFAYCAISFLSSSIFCANTFAKETEPNKIYKSSGNMSIDAELNEPQWQNATKILINNITKPYDNLPSPVQTEAYLMEDGVNFYLAFIAYDNEPEKIRAYLRDRDKAWNDDLVGIKIDTFNDQRTAYRFLVNPLGVQIDGIENEVTKKENDAWDGIWQSSGKITDQGFIVEMALPLTMLNFNDKLALQTWGFELLRFYPRQEKLRISNIQLDRGNSCEICQMHKIEGFAGIKQGSNLIITPSLVAGKSESRSNEEDNFSGESNTEPSLDIRWGITPDILLNATINPDFSTVESDNPRLNVNNNFALFNQEKRPFFLDNADYFEADYNLVYTRNINAPNAGAKLTGRQNQHSFGVFLTDDQTTNILIPGNLGSSIAEIAGESKAAAIRYRNNVNNNTTVGWISTFRSAQDYQNSVHGIDARFRLSTADVFQFQSLYSSTQYPEDLFEQFCKADEPKNCLNPDENDECDLYDCDYNEQVLRTLRTDKFSGNAITADFSHSDRNWNYNARYEQQNSGFRGDLGFIPKIDFNKKSLKVERKWYGDVESFWNKFSVEGQWESAKNDNNELIEEGSELNVKLNAIYNSKAVFTFKRKDKVGNRFDKSSLTIDGNTTLFTEDRFEMYGEITPIQGLFINLKTELGDGIDYASNRLGDIKEIRSNIHWNVNQHLEMKYKLSFKELNADNDHVFIARLSDLRTTYYFNVQSYLRFTLIYNNIYRNPYNYLYKDPEDITAHSHKLSTELLYAYKINPQTVFYLGYSDHYESDEDIKDLYQDQRSVFMKISYAWIK